MRKIREVLRLKYESGLSHRSISASTGMSKGSVSDYLRRAGEAGLTWELAQGLDDRVDIRPPPPRSRLVHENLRGGKYYDQKEMEKNDEERSEGTQPHDT